jgi:hypothetical protein
VLTLTRAYINDQRRQNRYQILSHLIQNLYLRYQIHQSLYLRYQIHQNQNRLNQSQNRYRNQFLNRQCHFRFRYQNLYRYQNQCRYRGLLCQILRCRQYLRLHS